ncbi:MAG: alpha/beta hydrolase [Caulobacteraceae bacterium]
MTGHTHETAPTQYVEANGIRFAYRRFGKTGGAPIVLNLHFRGTMDHWDPKVTDGLAQNREVILFDNAGVGASSGETPANFPAVATDTIAFINALRISKTDVLGYSIGGKVAQEIAVQAPDLVRKLILAGTGPRGADTAASKGCGDILGHIRSARTSLDRRAFLVVARRSRSRPRVPRTQTPSPGPQSGGLRALGGRAARGDRDVKREDRRCLGLLGRNPSSDARRAWQQRLDHSDRQRLYAATTPAERATHHLSRLQPRAVLPVSGTVLGPRVAFPR